MSQPRPGGPGGSHGRPERPLGRGLEDVSHVFFTPQGEPGSIDPRAPWAARPVPREDTPPGALLLRPAAQLSREQVGAALKEFAEALEPGLRVVDAGLPCAPCGEIDLLAVDRTGRLAILDFVTATGDELLVRGLGHVDWAARNVPILRRMLRGQTINFSLSPRLFLLAPEFSPRMRSAARQVTAVQLDWVRYHLVDGAGQPAILFEPLVPE